ncbi:Leucine-, isoleucine-, valine-, (threonine-, and alanine-) binding protein [Granulibacter bethesdensis]|nr:Leucine-, isoleucine-, valine-, (threonine-, and alanine-) binding protein [Granulibacter bethesdensis]
MHRWKGDRMRRRTLSLLVASLALAGCSNTLSGGSGPLRLSGSAGQGSGKLDHLAILLPLSGPDAARGQAMLKAAQLALDVPGSPRLEPMDTHGTPNGAAQAAQAAVAGGAYMILGPFSAAETGAAAGPARQAGIPVLAFTSSPAQAQPGIWVMGLTPDQQVERLVQAARAQGKTHIAALLPNTELGSAMGRALVQFAPDATVRHYSGGMEAMNATVRDLSGYASRRGPLEQKIREAKKNGDRKLAAELSRNSVPPPPFDALLLADVGTRLAEIGSLLPYYDINTPTVRIMGPALWSSERARAGSGDTLNGAWYAAPDQATRTDYVQRYQTKYGSAPLALQDLAYDAASIARVIASEGSVSADSLTRPAGFAGVDGVLVLHPDGKVSRGLALYEIESGSPKMIEPAPQTLNSTGS